MICPGEELGDRRRLKVFRSCDNNCGLACFFLELEMVIAAADEERAWQELELLCDWTRLLSRGSRLFCYLRLIALGPSLLGLCVAQWVLVERL